MHHEILKCSYDVLNLLIINEVGTNYMYTNEIINKLTY